MMDLTDRCEDFGRVHSFPIITRSAAISIRPSEELDLDEIEELIDVAEGSVYSAPNRVHYDMNHFVICAGSYIPELSEKARRVAESIGKVSVDMGGTQPSRASGLEGLALLGTMYYTVVS